MKTAGVWQQRPSARKTWRPLHPPLTTQQTLSEETAGPESLSIRNDKAADDDQNRQYWTWLLDCGKFVPSHRTKAGPGSDGGFFLQLFQSFQFIFFRYITLSYKQTNKQVIRNLDQMFTGSSSSPEYSRYPIQVAPTNTAFWIRCHAVGRPLLSPSPAASSCVCSWSWLLSLSLCLSLSLSVF